MRADDDRGDARDRWDALALLFACGYVLWFFALGAVAGIVRLTNDDDMPGTLGAVLITLLVAPVVIGVCVSACLGCRSAWRDLRGSGDGG
jgi:hypothetical protein